MANKTIKQQLKQLWHKWLGLVVGLVMVALGWQRSRADNQTMKKLDFSTSTQRMGISFTEKIRDNFRKRWLKFHHTDYK